MKYIKSTTSLSYTFEGIKIPTGENEPVAVRDDVYQKMQNNKAIASLIKNQQLLVLDTYVSKASVNSDVEARLRSQIAYSEQLQRELAQAKRQNDPEMYERLKNYDELVNEHEELKKEANSKLSAQASEIESLQKAVAEMKKMMEAREAEFLEEKKQLLGVQSDIEVQVEEK